MKRILSVSALIALLAIGVLAKNQRWTGYVSDAKCGVKLDPACTKKCVGAGEKVVFVSDGDKSVMPVANPDRLKDHVGQHLLIEGRLENNMLTVSNVKIMNDEKKVNDSSY